MRTQIDGVRTARLAVGGSLAALVASFTGLSVATPSATAASGPKIAFVMDGSSQDGGWNSSHARAVATLEKQMPGVQVKIIDNTPPGDQARSAFDDLASQGYQLIVGTTTYTSDIFAVARRYPDVKFVNYEGGKTASNVGDFDLASEDGRYLDGIVAGSVTKKGLIGYLAPYPTPEVVRSIDALERGAQTVRPNVKIKVVWINSWYDPGKERQAANSLVDAGADVLAGEINSPAMQTVAEKRHVGVIGYGWNQQSRSPHAWLSSFTLDWAPYYLQEAKAIANGTWKPTRYYGGIPQGAIGSAPLGKAVSKAARAKVARARGAIRSGKLDVFAGPLYDNQGHLEVAKGKTIPHNQRSECCNWFVKGVEGRVSTSG